MANTTWKQVVYDVADGIRTLLGTSSTIPVGELKGKLTGITRKAAATYTPSTSAQTIAAGQYLEGDQTIAAMPTGALSDVSVSSNGLITQQVGTSGYLASGTKKTKQLTTQAAKTITPSNSSQTAVASGVYTTGAVLVAAVQTETKTVTPTGSTQTITPSSGKYLSSVTVEAASSDVVNGSLTTLPSKTAISKNTFVTEAFGSTTLNSLNNEIWNAGGYLDDDHIIKLQFVLSSGSYYFNIYASIYEIKDDATIQFKSYKLVKQNAYLYAYVTYADYANYYEMNVYPYNDGKNFAFFAQQDLVLCAVDEDYNITVINECAYKNEKYMSGNTSMEWMASREQGNIAIGLDATHLLCIFNKIRDNSYTALYAAIFDTETLTMGTATLLDSYEDMYIMHQPYDTHTRKLANGNYFVLLATMLNAGTSTVYTQAFMVTSSWTITGVTKITTGQYKTAFLNIIKETIVETDTSGTALYCGESGDHFYIAVVGWTISGTTISLSIGTEEDIGNGYGCALWGCYKIDTNKYRLIYINSRYYMNDYDITITPSTKTIEFSKIYTSIITSSFAKPDEYKRSGVLYKSLPHLQKIVSIFPNCNDYTTHYTVYTGGTSPTIVNGDLFDPLCDYIQAATSESTIVGITNEDIAANSTGQVWILS